MEKVNKRDLAKLLLASVVSGLTVSDGAAMSLYDDDDDAELKLSGAKAAMGSTGWSKGASWMQSAQKQSLAMAASGAAVKKTVEAARPQQQAFPKPVSLPPVINLQKSGGGGGAGGAKKSSASSSAEMDSAPKFIYGGDKVS